MGSVMAQDVKILETHDSKTQMEVPHDAEHADEEAQGTTWSVVSDESETQLQGDEDEADESDSDSESTMATDSGIKFQECWKFIILWKVLSLPGLLACWTFLPFTEESVDIASMFDFDVECCAGGAAGLTAFCTKANVCLPCEFDVNAAVSE
jgi:hypothetical protein